MTKNKSKERESMQAENAKAPDFTFNDLLALVRASCVFIVPISIVVIFIASWISAYQKWGTTGLLVNGFLCLFVGLLLYKICNDIIGNKTDKVDSEQSDN